MYDGERFDIEEKRRLAANRAAVRARLAEVVHGNAFFSMRQKLTKRKLRAKALRLAAKHAVGGKARATPTPSGRSGYSHQMLWKLPGTGEAAPSPRLLLPQHGPAAEPPRLRWDTPRTSDARG